CGGLVAHGADDAEIAARELSGEPVGGFGDLAGAVGDDGFVWRAFVLDADAHARVASDVVEFDGVSRGAKVELAVSEGVPDRRGQRRAIGTVCDEDRDVASVEEFLAFGLRESCWHTARVYSERRT